jgi:hypothetical protein
VWVLVLLLVVGVGRCWALHRRRFRRQSLLLSLHLVRQQQQQGLQQQRQQQQVVVVSCCRLMTMTSLMPLRVMVRQRLKQS